MSATLTDLLLYTEMENSSNKPCGEDNPGAQMAATAGAIFINCTHPIAILRPKESIAY